MLIQMKGKYMKTKPSLLKGIILCATLLIALGFAVNTAAAADVVVTIGPSQDYDNFSDA